MLKWIMSFGMLVMPIHHHHTPPAPVVKNDSYFRLAECESGNKPNSNTGNGFYGAFQFDLKTWWGLGKIGLPSNYSYRVQRKAAVKLHRQRGWEPWPQCSQQLGL